MSETYRLTGITTRGGDTGITSLADGTRAAKTSQVFAAIGAIDELNSQIGFTIACVPNNYIKQLLVKIQHALFDAGGELASNTVIISSAQVLFVDKQIIDWNADLPPLKNFVLPGGNTAAAACHVARSMCRRAERECWILDSGTSINPLLLQYLNRLSDLLFVLSRVLARQSGGKETIWRS